MGTDVCSPEAWYSQHGGTAEIAFSSVFNRVPHFSYLKTNLSRYMPDPSIHPVVVFPLASTVRFQKQLITGIELAFHPGMQHASLATLQFLSL